MKEELRNKLLGVMVEEFASQANSRNANMLKKFLTTDFSMKDIAKENSLSLDRCRAVINKESIKLLRNVKGRFINSEKTLKFRMLKLKQRISDLEKEIEDSSKVKGIEFEEDKRDVLVVPIRKLPLSTKIINVLRAAECEVVADIITMDPDYLLKFRGFGKKSLVELQEYINDQGLKWGETSA